MHDQVTFFFINQNLDHYDLTFSTMTVYLATWTLLIHVLFVLILFCIRVLLSLVQSLPTLLRFYSYFVCPKWMFYYWY